MKNPRPNDRLEGRKCALNSWNARHASAISNSSFLLFVPINEPACGIDSLLEIGIPDRSLDDQIDRI
jgi:hypothetical protein